MGKNNLVIVESPAKAKTINKYLGKDFEVLASFGHVRDLLPKDGSVNPEKDFALIWDVDSRGAKHLKAISDACKRAERIYLATDPDREGEAISWHVYEELRRRKAVKDVERIDRIVFHEITPQAVSDSLQHPRKLDQNLVDAYLARRVLDYLVGFNLSPVLWRKLPGAKSAGRVQSVALRLICEREQEIKVFKSREYWSVFGLCHNSAKQKFTAKLSRLEGKELQKFSLGTETEAKQAAAAVKSSALSVSQVENKQKARHPYPPFTTSTLQQDANRKLGFGSSRTMQIAQKLYEGMNIGDNTTGLITYMRTDSTHISNQAIAAARKTIGQEFGEAYLPDKPKFYKTKTKNAQEAHEAIRPTNFSLTPTRLRQYLNPDEARLYELIWQRALASQMQSAKLEVTTAIIESADKKLALRASGTVVKFDGFLRLYNESPPDDKAKDKGDEEDAEDNKKALPRLQAGESIACLSADPRQHFTQPPPRYSEAGLVKKMEEIGIGRPSTYASILKILQDRAYVDLDKRRFIPTGRGQSVSAFLFSFFNRYVDYEFTAALEDDLDAIARGQADWKNILKEFWQAFHASTSEAMELSFENVRNELDKLLCDYFFVKDELGDDSAARKCPKCEGGRLSLNFGKYGVYVSCSNYPKCTYTKQGTENSNASDSEDGDYPKILGEDDGQKISLKLGPYGFYVQKGEGKKSEVKRVGLPKGMSPSDVDLCLALKLLTLPRLLGKHPDSGDKIHACLGHLGPYLKHGAKNISLNSEENVLEIGLNRAVEVIATKKSGGNAGTSSQKIREIGKHPVDNGSVDLLQGRYGYYVKWQKTNVGLPKGRDPENVTLEEAVEWIEHRQKNPSKKLRGKKAKARAKKP